MVIEVTRPVGLIVATVAGAIVHVPPGTLLPSARLLPAHMGALPMMGPGAGFTVMVSVTMPQNVV